VGLTETNVDWQHRGTKAKCTTIFRKYWQRVNVSTSSSDHRFDRVYQPGGTATIVGSPWAGRAKSSTDSSGLGRWSVTHLLGRTSSKVAVITAYRATGTHSKGPFTAYSQQTCLLRQRDNRTTPEEEFYIDLGNYIQRLRQEGTSVILMMDANDSMQRHSSKLTKWVKQHELIDPHTYLHGTADQPPTYIGGSTRIDYFLVSPDLIPYVSQAGIIPFNGYYESNHRALFINIDLSRVLKGMPHDPISRENRAISSTIPWKVTKYQQYVLKECQASQIFSHAKAFEIRNKGSPMTNELQKELDGIDAELTAIQLEAEQLCKTRRHLPWSPTLKQCNNRIRYWRLWIRELRRHKDYGILRASIEVSFEVPTSYPTLREAMKQLRLAVSASHTVQKQAAALRVEFLEKRASFLSSTGERKLAGIVKRIQNAETKSQIFQHLRCISGKIPPPPLSYLLKDTGGTSQTIVDSEEIDRELYQRNISHFSQADPTPFAQGELQQLFGKTGSNEFSTSVLKGDSLPASLTDSIAKSIFFTNLQKSTDAPEISGRITGPELQEGYRAWRETTSTSPSGLHLGHDKTMLLTTLQTDDMDLTAAYFDHKARMINLALRHRHVYKR
jgi:hypothetical protein